MLPRTKKCRSCPHGVGSLLRPKKDTPSWHLLMPCHNLVACCTLAQGGKRKKSLPSCCRAFSMPVSTFACFSASASSHATRLSSGSNRGTTGCCGCTCVRIELPPVADEVAQVLPWAIGLTGSRTTDHLEPSRRSVDSLPPATWHG